MNFWWVFWWKRIRLRLRWWSWICLDVEDERADFEVRIVSKSKLFCGNLMIIFLILVWIDLIFCSWLIFSLLFCYRGLIFFLLLMIIEWLSEVTPPQSLLFSCWVDVLCVILMMRPIFTRISHLQNTVSLVTGGASGLGRATVERFARNGGKVVLCDLATSKGHEVAKEIGDNVVYVPVDVSIFDGR